MAAAKNNLKPVWFFCSPANRQPVDGRVGLDGGDGRSHVAQVPDPDAPVVRSGDDLVLLLVAEDGAGDGVLVSLEHADRVDGLPEVPQPEGGVLATVVHV